MVLFLFVPATIGVGGVLIVYGRAANRIPATPQDSLQRTASQSPTQIYAADGQTLLFSIESSLDDAPQWVTLDALPEYVVDATILWEDPDFMERSRGSLLTFADKFATNYIDGSVDDDTTITGRLARNVILPQREFMTTDDRAEEIATVTELNRRFSREEILEWHLNTNYYGSEAYGIDAAARIYLGKSATDLTLDEAALLIAIPTAPRFNPVDDETAARGRQSDMLRRMLAADIITQSEFEAAINVTTVIRPDAGQLPLLAPDFALFARRQAETILNSTGLDGGQLISSGGLRITTTLDVDLYYQAECALRNQARRLRGEDDAPALDSGPCSSAQYMPPNFAEAGETPPDSGTVAIIDTNTGELVAMVGPGSRASYEPGPVLAPFVYLNGFLNAEYTPASMLLDIPRTYPGRSDGLLYLPQNSDGLFRGPLSLRDAMGGNLRLPAIQVANILNLNTVLRDTVAPMGIVSLRNQVFDLSLLEDGGAVPLIEVAHAYSVLATLGDAYGLPAVTPQGFSYHQPIAVRHIEDGRGEVLWDYDALQIAQNLRPVLQDNVAFLMNHVLSDSSTRTALYGQGSVLDTIRPTGIVSGTTGDQSDTWTVGYTPELVVAVHMERQDGLPTTLPAASVNPAAYVWRAVTDYVYARDGLPAVDWQRPDSIVETEVCEISGMSPNGICDTRREIFLDAGQVPPPDTYWTEVEVNSSTNLLATVNTPAELRAGRRYFVPPLEAREWWEANNRPLPPTQYDTFSRPNELRSTIILQPDNLDAVSGVVDIRGDLDDENMEYFVLRYGQGANPSTWFDITDRQTEYNEGVSLGLWDTAGLDGTYVLELNVVLNDGTRDVDVVQVIVDNVPPAVVLNAGEPGQTFQWPEDEAIPLAVDVNDNYKLDRVEFYHNGQLVGIDNEAPYGYDHEINRAGIEEFTATVFDSVGNTSSSSITVEVVRSG